MTLDKLLNTRRSLRTLGSMNVSDELVATLAHAAQRAPSCYNNQPWRFVFVYKQAALDELKSVLANGNAWAKKAPLIIAVYATKKDDCIVKEREYYLFDTGMAVMNMLLKAEELGLVMHPVAGFSQQKAKEILSIPNDATLITLIIAGKKTNTINDELEDWQKESERNASERNAVDTFVFHNSAE